jgi:hypothetical protein
MGGLIRRCVCIQESGTIDLTAGRQDVEIDLDFALDNVFVSCVSEEFPICQGDLNYLAVTLLDTGFVLSADIRSGAAQVQWIAVGSPDTHGHGNQDEQ